MKKILSILTALLIIASSSVSAQDSSDPFSNACSQYEEYIKIALDDVGEELIDTENIFVIDITEDYHVRQMDEFSINEGYKYFVLPVLNSEDKYFACFTNNKHMEYIESILNFSWIRFIKDVTKESAYAVIAENNLPVPEQITILHDESRHVFSYYCKYDTQNYIIPISILEGKGNPFDFLKDETKLKIGKAFTEEEYREIYIAENEKKKEYYLEQRKKEGIYETIVDGSEQSVYVDENGEEHMLTDEEREEIIKEQEEKEKNTDMSDSRKKEEEDDEDEEPDIEPKPVKKENEEGKEITLKTDEIIFFDVPANHYAYSEINEFSKQGIINGYGNGCFGAEDSITYEHFGLLLDRLFDYNPDNTEASPAVREDIIVSVVKAIGIDVSTSDENVISESFTDCDNIRDENKKYIAGAIEKGIIVGSDGKLFPDKELTRAETVVLLQRAVNYNR